MSETIQFREVDSGPDLDEIRLLFTEYAKSLNFSLCFQGFDRELETLPGVYGRPSGRLYLCEVEGKPAGCIALKPLEVGACEMKRLFVRPEFRGKRLGVKLAEMLIEEARQMGYSAMRLDTIRGMMDNAIGLYASLGFKEIPPYYENPIANAVYMELAL